MSKQNKPRKNAFFNLYFTSTVSISLVLFMVGLITFLITFTNEITQFTKEHIALSLVLSDNANEADVTRLSRFLDNCDFVKEKTYVTKEQALQEHIADLGEDPTELLGYNPLRASVEIYLKANYACNDSIEMIKQKLHAFQGIEEFVYQEDMLQLLNQNVNKLTLIFGGVALVLLFISIVLINNTIRIAIYSKRFLINTMKLVGARPGFIRRPFLLRSFGNSIIAAILALAMLGGALYYVQTEIGDFVNLYQLEYILPVAGVVVICSVIIMLLATLFAVNRYLRMKTDDLFFI